MIPLFLLKFSPCFINNLPVNLDTHAHFDITKKLFLYIQYFLGVKKISKIVKISPLWVQKSAKLYPYGCSQGL